MNEAQGALRGSESLREAPPPPPGSFRESKVRESSQWCVDQPGRWVLVGSKLLLPHPAWVPTVPPTITMATVTARTALLEGLLHA